MLAIVDVAVAGSQPIASRAHTVRMVAIFLVLAAAGLWLLPHLQAPGAGGTGGGSHLSLYLSLMASEWLLFRAVSAGIGRTGMGWRDLMGAPAFAWKGWLPDVAIAAAIVAAWIAPLLLRRASSASGPGAAAAMLPRGGFEIALWIGLSASAGICEEFTFRGYFQRQFAALTRRPWLGLGLQAVLFGVAHSYEGISSTAAITVYGAVLGGVAAWRGNLRAAIMAHVFTDLAMGVFFG